MVHCKQCGTFTTGIDGLCHSCVFSARKAWFDGLGSSADEGSNEPPFSQFEEEYLALEDAKLAVVYAQWERKQRERANAKS